MKKGYSIIASLLTTVTISACGSTAPAPTATPTIKPTATPTVAPTNTPAPTPVPTESPTEINAVRNHEIYSYVQELLDSPQNPALKTDIGSDIAAWQKSVEEYENKVLEQAAVHFGLTVEEVDNIYLNEMSNLY